MFPRLRAAQGQLGPSTGFSFNSGAGSPFLWNLWNQSALVQHSL